MESHLKAVVSVLKWIVAQLLWRLFQIVVFFAAAFEMFGFGFTNMVVVYGGAVLYAYGATVLASAIVDEIGTMRRAKSLDDSSGLAAFGPPLVQFDKEIPGVTTLEGERIGNGFRVR